jgi:aconitate hydratase
MAFANDRSRREEAQKDLSQDDLVWPVADAASKRTDTSLVKRANGKAETITALCRIDTLDELEYYRHGGILQYVLRSLMAA